MSTHSDEIQPLLIVGDGDLARRVLLLLSMQVYDRPIVLAARSADRARSLVNLARYCGTNVGLTPELSVTPIDLSNQDALCTTLANLAPAEILMTASLEPAPTTSNLSPDILAALSSANMGPWLPLHLAPNYDLMTAVLQLEHRPKVINAAFPDSVGPVLAQAGLAPDLGVGSLADIVPGLLSSASETLDIPSKDIQVDLVAHRYFSQRVSHYGQARRLPYALSVTIFGEKGGFAPDAQLFEHLKTRHEFFGAADRQILTASSTVRLLQALRSASPRRVHAPAPGGRVGGYPLLVSEQEYRLDLPIGMSESEAVAINTAGQVLDGIEAIASDGSVIFTDREMTIMEHLIGYRCDELKLVDVHSWADELNAKYAAFLRRHA